ncbi:MAG: hypothetical protein QXT45_03515 [Candidatus Bilamarchaeaceae archaeon]
MRAKAELADVRRIYRRLCVALQTESLHGLIEAYREAYDFGIHYSAAILYLRDINKDFAARVIGYLSRNIEHAADRSLLVWLEYYGGHHGAVGE